MDAVKRLVQAGASIPGAIKEALAQRDLSVVAFADRHGLPRSTTGDVINGLRRPTAAQVDALIAELGGDAPEWRFMLWRAGEVPEPAGR